MALGQVIGPLGHWATSYSYLACLRLLAKVSLCSRAAETESKAAHRLDMVMTACNPSKRPDLVSLTSVWWT